MRTRMLQCMITIFLAIMLVPSTALAQNAHQNHRGACAKSTTSISKGVSDLQYNGVARRYAKAIGIKTIDGSVTKQLKNRLTIGEIVVAVRTDNEGCDGHGGRIDAGTRSLYKGEKVAVKTPAKYGKDVCVHSHKNCRAVVITVQVVFPTSCWNKNTKKVIRVKIWIKKKPSNKPGKKCKGKKCKPRPARDVGCKVTQNGSNHSFITINGCNNNVTVTCSGQGSCSTTNITQQQCVDNGGDWNSHTEICTFKKEGCGDCPPPPPPANARCVDLVVSHNNNVARGVFAHVDYEAQNATLQSVTFNWGDGSPPETVSSTDASHVYSAANAYTISATLRFTTPNGGSVTATCSDRTITPKDGTQSPGTGSGPTNGGDGADGSAGNPSSGGRCIDPMSGNPRDVKPGERTDPQTGECRPATLV